MTSSIARPRDLKRVISAWLVRPAWRLSSTWPISATTWSWPRSPARMGITRSPASARADWRLSANTVAAATASVDSSRTVGRQAPTAFTCAPGPSMPPVTTGSTLATAVQTRLAPSSASATDSRTSTGGPKRSPAHSASALAWAWVRLQTRMRSSRRTAAIASRWLRAWVPAPTIARSRASEAASARVATADTAPVRISVIAAASSTAVGTPVWGSNMVTVPWWVSRPRAGFPGWMVTVLIPKPSSDLGDRGGVEHRRGHARLGVEHGDRALVGVQAAGRVPRVDGHRLDPEAEVGAGPCRHGGHHAGGSRRLDDHPQRLDDRGGAVALQRLAHLLDGRWHREWPPASPDPVVRATRRAKPTAQSAAARLDPEVNRQRSSRARSPARLETGPSSRTASTAASSSASAPSSSPAMAWPRLKARQRAARATPMAPSSMATMPSSPPRGNSTTVSTSARPAAPMVSAATPAPFRGASRSTGGNGSRTDPPRWWTKAAVAPRGISVPTADGWRRPRLESLAGPGPAGQEHEVAAGALHPHGGLSRIRGKIP